MTAPALCVGCHEEFDPHDSIGGDFGQCQNCWEAECSRSWWEFMRRMDEAFGLIGRSA